MTMLEKLCRAACEADFKDPDTPVRIEDLVNWQLYRRPVLAVLSTLEQPDEEMIAAGIAQLEECTFDWTSAGPCGAEHAFTAMIRKAKEG